MSDTYHFQVNLGGMLDVLSNHLYKSPDVFLRELLQNGVDAITLRQKSQPDWNGGKITITVEPGRRLIFRDNGAGLSEEGIHRFLAVIGQSSKTELVTSAGSASACSPASWCRTPSWSTPGRRRAAEPMCGQVCPTVLILWSRWRSARWARR